MSYANEEIHQFDTLASLTEQASREYGELPEQLRDIQQALTKWLIESRPSVTNPYTGQTDPVEFALNYEQLCADCADLVINEMWRENLAKAARDALRILEDA